MKFNRLLGMGIGVILIVIPDPATTAIGLGIVAYSAYKSGWLGRP